MENASLRPNWHQVPRNTLVTLNVFCETGSEKSPPGGETAPTKVSDPIRSCGDITTALPPLS